jgi:hypothetical protein
VRTAGQEWIVPGLPGIGLRLPLRLRSGDLTAIKTPSTRLRRESRAIVTVPAIAPVIAGTPPMTLGIYRHGAGIALAEHNRVGSAVRAIGREVVPSARAGPAPIGEFMVIKHGPIAGEEEVLCVGAIAFTPAPGRRGADARVRRANIRLDPYIPIPSGIVTPPARLGSCYREWVASNWVA